MIRARPGRYSHDVPLPESRLACRRESRETLSSREGGVGELHEAEDSCCLAFDKPRDVRNGSRVAMPSKSPLRRVHPRKRPCWRRAATSALGHVWTAPGWQGFSLRVQQWSEQPCVRPVSAVHVTAGHNALRGSGPGQKHAFDNALARVGCPDRRIDQLCITCCSPLPTVHIAPTPGAICFTPLVRRVPCSPPLSSSSPRPCERSCWRAQWRRPWLAAALLKERQNIPPLELTANNHIAVRIDAMNLKN